MNKFLTFAILAVAAIAVANAAPFYGDVEDQMTEAALITTDDQETAAVDAKGLSEFDDYCTQTRDYVFSTTKKESNKLISKMFNIFFSTGEEIGREGLAEGVVAREKLAEQLENPQGQIVEARTEVEKIVADGQEQIKNQANQANAFIAAFKAQISAVSKTVGDAFAQRFNYVKSMANPQQLVMALRGGCERIAQFEKELRGQFSEYKMSSAVSDKHKDLSLDDVPCVTAHRIIRADGLCGFVRVAEQPVKKMIGYRQ